MSLITCSFLAALSFAHSWSLFSSAFIWLRVAESGKFLELCKRILSWRAHCRNISKINCCFGIKDLSINWMSNSKICCPLMLINGCLNVFSKSSSFGSPLQKVLPCQLIFCCSCWGNPRTPLYKIFAGDRDTGTLCRKYSPVNWTSVAVGVFPEPLL